MKTSNTIGVYRVTTILSLMPMIQKTIYRNNPLTKDHMKFGERKHYHGELILWGRAIVLSKLLLLPSEKGSTIKGANLQILSFLKRPLRDLQCRRVNTITLVPFL